MTRVDHHTEEDHAALKEEIAEELREDGKRRRRRGCLVYLVLLALIIGIPIVWVGTVVARTGLADVPVLSSMMYDPVYATRVVNPLVGSTSEDILTSLGARAKYDITTGTLEMRVTEQELTTLVFRGVVGKKSGSPFTMQNAQVVIMDRTVEFFAIIEKDGRKIPLLVSAVPSARDNTLDLQIEGVIIGGYAVPNALTTAAMTMFGGGIQDAADTAIASIGELKSLRLEDGTANAIILPDRSLQ